MIVCILLKNINVPVYDKTKKEIISMSAGKSVDMTDINHGHNIVN